MSTPASGACISAEGASERRMSTPGVGIMVDAVKGCVEIISDTDEELYL